MLGLWRHDGVDPAAKFTPGDSEIAITETRYPKRRQALLKAFRERETISEQ